MEIGVFSETSKNVHHDTERYSQSYEKFESVVVSVRRVWRHRHSRNNKEAVLFLTRLITTTWAELLDSTTNALSRWRWSWRQGKSQLYLTYIRRRHTSQIAHSRVDVGIARLTYRAQLQSEYTLIPTETHHTSDIIKVWTAFCISGG